MSPWFLLCMSAVAYYANITSPRYNRIFAVLCGFFLALGLLTLGMGRCHAQDLPNAKLTPGVVNPALTKAVICDTNWSTKSVRDVPARLKQRVYAAYHRRDHAGYCRGKEGCELDHLISLELGGANAFRNLWPQSYSTKTWNAHVKDKLENRLHELVCAGKISLSVAQHSISTDWIAAYKKYVKPK